MSDERSYEAAPILDVSWVFFDIGSTLYDESECIKARVESTVQALGGLCTLCEFWTFMEREARANSAHPYRAVMEKLGSDIFMPWKKELEKPYPETARTLEKLCGKYRLGIIANQSRGTRLHLAKFGLEQFFNVVISSEEVGLEKPDPQIFKLALTQANCPPKRAVMIGDRLDNDIYPAKKLGMKTVWVKQGWGGLANLPTSDYTPDFEVDNLGEIPELLFMEVIK
jgi:HAD superfamily hydrolase (TIGR01549 family)